MDETYFDLNGDCVDLSVMCLREPGWAANRIRVLTQQVDDLRRGHDQMLLLAELPLPPDVVAKLDEADRMRAALGKLLEENGCDCPCDHHPDERGPDCEVCLACRIEEVIGKWPRLPLQRVATP